MTRFDGQSIVITGGAAGIGAATAEAFLRLGGSVVIVDHETAQLEAKRQELSSLGIVVAVTADVSIEADVVRYVAAAVTAFGRIDVFFNNAGVEGPMERIVDTEVEEFDRVLAVNLRGCFLGLKHVLRVMTAQGSGSVINSSSVAGLSGSPRLGAYVASKHGVTGLTKVASLEVAASGIRVNSIHPSPVNTEMMRSLESGLSQGVAESTRQAFTRAIPLARYGEPDDIAQLVVFLGSDASSFITGAQYRIDGGMGAKS